MTEEDLDLIAKFVQIVCAEPQEKADKIKKDC